MFTFSDGELPLAIGAVKEAGIKFDDWFTFNNSAIWQCTDDVRTLTFANLGKDSYLRFGQKLMDLNRVAISTKLSREVIKARTSI